MTHYYKDGEWSKPGVTSIISDCFSQEWGPPWGAKMACEWIRQSCDRDCSYDDFRYLVSEEDLIDAAKHFREVSQDALDIGTAVHSAVEYWLKFRKEPLNPRPEVKSAFKAFREFYDEHKMKPLELEFSVIGDYWGGTLDYYGWFDGKLYVIDFKTSKKHYLNEHGPQIAAYRSELKKPCDGNAVLRLDKLTGYPDWKDYSKRYEKDLEHFRLMVPLYMHRHPRIAKKAGWLNKPF